MSDIILSDRLRSELEELLAHTPLAKERCRAQALLWLAEGRDCRGGRRIAPRQPPDGLQLGRIASECARDSISGPASRTPRARPSSHGVGDHRPPDRRGHRHRPSRAGLPLHGLDRARCWCDYSEAVTMASRSRARPSSLAIARSADPVEAAPAPVGPRPETWRQSKGG